ncbi:MAG: Nre family DNA repair protein [Candidatus Thorarchaeota archaeon]
MPQTKLEAAPKPAKTQSYDERVCSKCMGHRALCGITPCPLLMRAKAQARIDDAFTGTDLSGASPPSVFIGESGYPKVLAGPLIPPVRIDEAETMERPDLWLDHTLDEILSLRFSLVRTKKHIPVTEASDPSRDLAETQALALSENALTSEATLLKRPQFTTVFSNRTLPIGPSAPLKSFKLEDNPKIPKVVDKVTSDTDLKAVSGVMDLFQDGIRQEHITRLLSVGVLGQRKRRRLVPTKWSITATDDIIGRRLHRDVLKYEWINDFRVSVDNALGNTVALLFMPNAWQFEAMESWLGGLKPPIITDYEWSRGRKDYARSVAGAYYATKLPVLEYLVENRRQAGVIVFMEIDPQQWVPLGVWRFREIAKRALQTQVKSFISLEEALSEIGSHLRIPMHRWLETSKVYSEYMAQTKLTDFM